MMTPRCGTSSRTLDDGPERQCSRQHGHTGNCDFGPPLTPLPRESGSGEPPKERLRAVWDTYLTQVIPPGAAVVQVQECRRAFYAGAEAFFGIVMTMLDPGTEATDADLVKMDELDRELKQFAAAVKAGRA